jgi:glycosyltransferase involved in cell wall biosynthesis
MSNHPERLTYALITPARNEQTHIEKTIQSMISQTVPPVKWVIVDDGSADETANIVKKYLPTYAWMELVELPKQRERSFAGKVYAFNAGKERLQGLEYDILGNLDADLSFDTEYLEFLMGKFQDDPRLGVAGTVFEERGYSSATDSFEGQNHVAGGCQLFRRRCFEEIGGYVPNRAGGIDWIAVTTSRMMGWKTRSFREKSFFHYRSLGTAERGPLASLFSYGEKDYYLGGHPVWEICRVAHQATKKPFLAGGVALYSGYLWAAIRRRPRPVSVELMRFHRKEQMQKLRAILRTVFRFRRLDSFEVEVS